MFQKVFTNVNFINTNNAEDVKIENDGTVKCEICEENVPFVDWTEHSNTRHADIKPCIDVIPAATEVIIIYFSFLSYFVSVCLAF